MQNVVLVIHVLACIAMTGVIMLQRSEGGALGIGGGGGGLMTGQGVTSALVRTTMIFGGIFFITSLSLNVLANYTAGGESIIDEAAEENVIETDAFDPNDLNSDLLPEAAGDELERALGVETDEVSTIEVQPVPEGRESPGVDPQPEDDDPNQE